MSDVMDLIKSARKKIKQTSRKERPLTPPVGKTRLRILPGWDDENPMFFREWGQHWVKDGDGSILGVSTCKRIVDDEDCPVCDLLNDATRAATDDDAIEAISDMRAKAYFLFNAVHYDGDEPNTPAILQLTKTTADQLFELMEEYESDTGNSLIDLAKGSDIIISRKGTGLSTKYNIMLAPKTKTPPKAIMGAINNLDDYVLDSDENEKKALAGVVAVTGVTAASLAGGKSWGALTGPSDDDEDDLDDEIPFDEEDEIAAELEAEDASDDDMEDELETEPEPEPKTKAKRSARKSKAPAKKAVKEEVEEEAADDGFDDDMTDQDVEDLLKDLD